MATLLVQTGVGRRQQSQTVMPVSIIQLLQYSEESGPLQVFGLLVGLVKVVGQVFLQASAAQEATLTSWTKQLCI